VHCEPSCVYCYENAKGRCNHKGHLFYRIPRTNLPKGDSVKYLHKPVASDSDGGVIPLVADAVFEKAYPALFEFLSATEWDTDIDRTTGTLLLFCEEGMFKCCLNDRDGCLKTFMAAESFEALLQSVNNGLIRGSLDWRREKQPQRRGKRT